MLKGRAFRIGRKNIEKGATDLLVASSNGKRRINVLMDELKENRQKLSHLAEHETQYVELQKSFTARNRLRQNYKVSCKSGRNTAMV